MLQNPGDTHQAPSWIKPIVLTYEDLIKAAEKAIKDNLEREYYFKETAAKSMQKNIYYAHSAFFSIEDCEEYISYVQETMISDGRLIRDPLTGKLTANKTSEQLSSLMVKLIEAKVISKEDAAKINNLL